MIGVGTRWSDFTTASKSAFQDPDVRFVNVNVAVARRGQAQRRSPVDGRRARGARRAARARWPAIARRRDWTRARRRGGRARGRRRSRGSSRRRRRGALPDQAAVIGAVNDAAGRDRRRRLRGGLDARRPAQALARARPDGKGYHVEYGYSCMGYEIPGGMGVKLAAPEREVYVMIGDGSYLMLPGELATAVAERVPLIVVLVDNHGYASIGALSRSVGSAGFGTHYRRRANGALPADAPDGDALAGAADAAAASTSPPTPRASARA